VKFISLTVTSLANKSVKNYFEFNPVGLNLILGERNDNHDETNGVGKTALVESIQYCLGANLPKSFKGKSNLEKEDIFVVLNIEYNEKQSMIGRRLCDDSFAYISDSGIIEYELFLWESLTKDDFRKYIQNIIYSGFKDINIATAPSFSAIREYIIRDEKEGFTGIKIKNRNATSVNQILSFLALIPCNYESNILQQKNVIKDLDKQLKDIKEIGKEIKRIKLSHQKTLDDIDSLKSILSNADVAEKLNNDENQYYELKSRINNLYLQIRKLEFAQKQHYANIKDLENNLSKIKEFIGLEDFYKQTIGYFPDAIIKNYKEVYDYYQFMIGNRGEYIRKQLQKIEANLELLNKERDRLLGELSQNTHFAKNSNLVRDLQEISNQIAEKYKEIAEYNYKIELYSKKADIEKDRKKQLGILEVLTEKYKQDYIFHSMQTENIVNHFHMLNNKLYETQGELIFGFEESLKANAKTGRIKINCSIEDEDAHGRYYMKINMFDLSLMLNRVDKEQGLTFLFHDGSYSKPAPSVKEKVLTYVDSYLKEKNIGQYFVTINVEELSSEALSYFTKNKNVVIRLQRTDDNTERFMGLKY